MVNGFSSLNIVIESTISDVADVLDPLPHSLNIYSYHDDHSFIYYFFDKTIVMPLK